MKLQYWGTAASEGWPAPFCRCEACRKARALGGKNIRTRSQAKLDDAVLLDFPADTYFHALRYGTDLAEIRHILITHSHMDHFYPEDMILKADPYAHNQPVEQMSIYGNDVIIRRLRETITSCGMPEQKIYSCIHPVELTPFEGFSMDDYTVTPLLADHIPGENCLIYLIERNGKALLYAHDTGWFPDKTWEALEGKKLDLLSIDCTFVTHECLRGHLGLPNIRQVVERLEKMGCVGEETKVVINHFSHNIPVLHDELSHEAAKSGYLTAYDGMTVTV